MDIGKELFFAAWTAGAATCGSVVAGIPVAPAVAIVGTGYLVGRVVCYILNKDGEDFQQTYSLSILALAIFGYIGRVIINPNWVVAYPIVVVPFQMRA